MNREDLKQYSGKHVIIVLDGKQTSDAILSADDPAEAYLSVAKNDPEWTTKARYILTDSDVDNMSMTSGVGLIGKIYLKRDGDELIWDHSADPSEE
jgi:hypothetical protein